MSASENRQPGPEPAAVAPEAREVQDFHSHRATPAAVPEPVILAPLPVGISERSPAVPADDLRQQRVEQLRQEFAKAAGDPNEVTPDGRDYQARYLEALTAFDQQYIAIYGYSAYSSQQAWSIQHDSQ